jgi:hypothetical protein
MYIRLKKKLYNIVISLFYKFNHKYLPTFNTAFENKTLLSQECNFFDLQSQFFLDSDKFEKNLLITVIDRKDNYLNNEKYIFESWVKNKKYTNSDNLDFLDSHKRKILKNFSENSFKTYKKKIFLLPYYHNQAGHFMGEIFGSMLFFLELLKKRSLNEKLLIICPSPKWTNFFKKFYKNNVIFFSDNFFLNKNILFTKSQIFPKFHPFQNYNIAKNILSSKIENDNFKNKKVFLTSERFQRISNIKDLIIFLKKKSFMILNPKNINILELYKILNSAQCVISESGSIANNIHIARNKPYYLLLPDNYKIINRKWYRLAIIYNNFHSCLYRPIFCKKTINKDYPIPLTEQITVDLNKLKFL